MKIKSGFVLEEVGNSYLAVAVGERADNFAGLVRLNSTGAFLWNLMTERDISREELADKMAAAYEIDRETALRDISTFEETLKKGGILE